MSCMHIKTKIEIENKAQLAGYLGPNFERNI